MTFDAGDEFDDFDLDPELEVAAAALHVGLAARDPSWEPMPAALRARVLSAAVAQETPAPSAQPGTTADTASPSADRPTLSILPWLGWPVAAALTLWAVLGTKSDAPRDLRAELLASSDLVERTFDRTEDPGAGTSEGSFKWSQSLQVGLIEVEGLPTNDPDEFVYQLWIFDDSRDHPVDGGVFNIADGQTEVLVESKLPVRQGSLVAVTLEEPGGVVVSEKEHIVLVTNLQEAD